MTHEIPESDWKALRPLREAALERFCARVLQEIADLSARPGQSAHDRYLAIYRLLERRDDELAHAFNDWRRSRAIQQAAIVASLGLFEPDELTRLSAATREAIASLVEFLQPRRRPSDRP